LGSVAIIDYGSGNLRSAAKAFERSAAAIADRGGPRYDIRVTNDPAIAADADHFVLPGVGAFADCYDGLASLPGMIECLTDAVVSKGKPFLGICVGMQLLATIGLEHGRTDGLGWLPGEVRPLAPADPSLKVPHMGWNELEFRETSAFPGGHMVLDGLNDGPAPHAYFVHSYHFCPDDPACLLATTRYGEDVVAIVEKSGRRPQVDREFSGLAAVIR
jgi:glutamine amidotransferase